MNVLSLFDGISCGRVALERQGISIDNYYASEIDKHAIAVAQRNFPSTIHLGDVREVKNLKNIDLLIGGSPCQGFSFAGKQLNFEDERSKLFFEYVRILDETKPKYFLLENVKMKKEYQEVITSYLGVKPIEINSALVSAQNRKRLYWTDIPNIQQPENKHIYLKDVLESGFVDRDKALCITASYYKGESVRGYFQKHCKQIVFESTQRITVIGGGGQGQRVYDVNGKSVALSALGGGQGAKTGLYAIALRGRNPDNPLSREAGLPTEQRLETSFSEKANCITSVQKDSLILGVDENDFIVRKLTPIECERLQTLPDNYTAGISNSQRYKALGNGWTVDIITHIFENIEQKRWEWLE